MKMKERFHAICRFLTMVSQGNHRVLFWLLGSAFAAATLPYLSLFFSARILNLLLAKSYRACLYTVVVFLLTQYGLGLFEKICRQYLDGQKELCLARTEQKITAKALELEFEKFEKTETMDAIRRTNVSSMGSGNVGDQLIVIHTLITSLLSVLYALFFLLRHHAFHAQGQLLDRSGQCTHFAYAFLQQGDSSVLTGIFLFEPTLELLMLGSRNRLVHLNLLSFVIQKMRGAGSPDSPARLLDLDFEVLQDFLNLLPNQRRNLIEGLLALHNEGCIDDCHDAFLLSQ